MNHNRIKTYPKVTIVGSTRFIDHPEYEIPTDGTHIERLGAFAAKGCYASWGKDGRSCTENQKAIIEHRHGAVLEHSYISLHLEGISRGLTLELNRHRPLGISQQSTRYVAEEDSAIVLEPWYFDMYNRAHFGGEASDEETKFINGHIKAAFKAIDQYKSEVEFLVAQNPLGLEGFELRKWARGKAKNILPHCLETKGVWTGNMRAWRHFIEVRSDPHAEEEIRRLAVKIFEKISPTAPTYFADYDCGWYPNNTVGYPTIRAYTTDNRKV